MWPSMSSAYRGRTESQMTVHATRASSTPQAAARDPCGAFVEICAPRDGSDGVLAGTLLAVKDMVDVAGRAPSFGLAAAPGPTPNVTAPVLARVIDAGARLIGFTRMTALAYQPSGGNAAQGRPLNPWSAAHVCGGSSSGSAVAVASGHAALALGSDTAGSLRVPAHCCGISAWKPSPGLVPTAGTLALAPSLDTIGFLACDAELLARVASLFVAPRAATGMRRIVIARDLLSACPSAHADAVTGMSRTLSDGGFTIAATELRALIDACDVATLELLQGEAATTHAARCATGAIDATLAQRLAKGAMIGPDRHAVARDSLRRLAGEPLADAFGGADAILLPVMPIATPLVAQCEPGTADFSPRTLYALSAWTRFVNGLGLPAVVIPAGFNACGLPVGVQLVGRKGEDAALLALAQDAQRRSDWHRRKPRGVAA